jgi:predicted P-loop ATPase
LPPSQAPKLAPRSADIDCIITNGAPKGQRSEAFNKVIWSLAARGHNSDQILVQLEKHPNGIAEKYIKRLPKEVDRCYRKWLAKNPTQAAEDGINWPDINKDGTLKRTYRNTREAIKALGVLCSYDTFHDRMLIEGNNEKHAINQWHGEVSDAAIIALRQLVIDAYGFDPGKDNTHDAASALCIDNRFDPVVEYLDNLDWDGTPRLDAWLTTYLGAPDTALNRAIGRLTLVAAVRRARKPGCKFDNILTLEGIEGTMKSTSIAVLAGVENFSDQTILTASDKEQQELVRGIWIYEIADLTGIKRAEIEKIKAFASRTHDRARPAYGRRRIDAPRRCIFIGTTNEDEYLQSQTGNRRFWPVGTGTINIDALRRDRDQLWAEAAEIEAQDQPLVLPQDLWGEARTQQEERRQSDPWDDILAHVTGILYSSADDAATEQEWIKATELLGHLQINKRLRKVMDRLGWKAGRHRFSGKKRQRGYWRPPDQGQ